MLSGRIVHGWREQRKEVLDVQNVELGFMQFSIHEIVGVARPYGLDRDLDLAARLYLRIVDVNRLHHVALGAEHPDLGFKALIFAAAKLVAVMQH